MSRVRWIGKQFVLLPLKLVARLCFDRRYLQGRLFEGTNTGWVLIARSIVWQKIIGVNRKAPWPVGWRTSISNHNNIQFDPEWWDIFFGAGTDFQNEHARIVIGSGTFIAANVTFVTANHDPHDLSRHLPGEDILVGCHCWLGTRSVILPGVQLGDHTIVAAGAVVTKSFPDGACVIGGVPARLIKPLQINS